MKMLFNPGDRKVYRTIIADADQAAFHHEVLHRVCSTFALARDFEWSSRLFFIDMKEDHEEGVGTFLRINHESPAFVGEEIVITSTVHEIRKNELVCNIEARVGDRLIATGQTGQKMLTREKLSRIFKQDY